MKTIERLNIEIAELSKMIDEYQIVLVNEPQDLSTQLTVKSIENQIAVLQDELRKENINREKEILKLRLIGRQAKYGSIPLLMVGGLTDSLGKAIFNTSKYYQFGNKGGDRIDRMIKDSIDLRLEGLGKGSVVFYMSGQITPDLFGNSIIQNSFSRIFNLLNSDNSEIIIENILSVGFNSIKYYTKFLNELQKDDLEIEMTWDTPTSEIRKWEGNQSKILKLYNTLTRINVDTPEEVDFVGQIISLSLKGKFEILTNENQRIFGVYPNELTQDMKLLHLGQICRGIFLKTTFLNPLTGIEKIEYSLKKISIA